VYNNRKITVLRPTTQYYQDHSTRNCEKAIGFNYCFHCGSGNSKNK